MTGLGWLFLAISLVFVWGLAGWCFYRILLVPETPPDPVRDFHSA